MQLYLFITDTMSVDGDSQLPSWRLWGEERTEGAVYTVYLKKVRYHIPSKSVGDTEDGISHLEWETVRVRMLKAGTLEKLVESLASDSGELESTYINIFLATYRTFTTASRVLRLITQRYLDLSDNKLDVPEHTRELHRKTMCMTMHVWLDTYGEDFKQPPNYPLLRQMDEFCKQHAPNSELALKVRHRLERLSRAGFELHKSGSYSHLLSTEDLTYHSVLSSLTNGPTHEEPHFILVFFEFEDKLIAEQLTRLDAELFKRLVPYQCLGSVWSRRDKTRGQGSETSCASVAATVDQFNAVSFRVISTVLLSQGDKNFRAKVILKWIDIAQELRALKNFSSLKAIISGLQSNPIYRLKHVWSAIPKDKLETYEELARIFSEENNQSAQRELLIREGTAKFAENTGDHDRHLQKFLHKQYSQNIIHGTIPYLGTFLTDLTMIDTAIPDTVSDGMINFDKRRKEFEILAQIKLLQGAANAYHISLDARFQKWFDSVLVLEDREAFQISSQIEPAQSQGSTGKRTDKAKRRFGHRKNDSIASTSSSCSSQFLSEVDGGVSHDTASLDYKLYGCHLSSSGSSSSLPSLDVSVSSGATNTTTSLGNGTPTKGSRANSLPRGVTPPNNSNTSPSKNADFYVIRVSLDTNTKETEGVNLYKSIIVSNNERTPQVIRNAMMKHSIEGRPEDYTLSQILPRGEMVLPPNANVYYAVNTSCDLNFVLRLKRNEESTPNTPSRTRFKEVKDGTATVKARKRIMSLGT